MSSIPTRRASYNHPHISIGKGHSSLVTEKTAPKRPSLTVSQRNRLDTIKRELSLCSSANCESSTNVHITNAYRMLRLLAQERLITSKK